MSIFNEIYLAEMVAKKNKLTETAKLSFTESEKIRIQLNKCTNIAVGAHNIVLNYKKP